MKIQFLTVLLCFVLPSNLFSQDNLMYHDMGDGLLNSQIKFEQNKKGRIAFIGGSITYGGGWRDSLMIYFKNRFPNTKFEFIAAGIGSMGSTPSAFRLGRDVLSKGRVDLLFVEAAVNDATNGRTSTEQKRAMEGIVRKSRRSNPNMDLVFMHFVDPDKMKVYRAGKEPEVIKNHNIIGEYYQIPTINLAKEVTERIDKGEFTWENDFINLHPSPFGHGIYANSMITFLNNAYSSDIDNADKIRAYLLPKKLDPFCYDTGSLINISTAELAKGWSINLSWKPIDGTGTRTNYVNSPMLISEIPGSTLNLKFKGALIGIAVAAGQDAGIIEYRIDNEDWKKLNLYTKWSKSLHLPWYYTLESELSANEHKLELRISREKDAESNGNACRIRYFFVNQNL